MNRYLIRIKKSNKDPKLLLQELRRIFKRVGNMRVSSEALEFDLFSNGKEEEIRKIIEFYGEVITFRKLGGSLKGDLKKVKELFKEERFWEVHEVLEEIWREEKGDRRETLQGLILFAAALVHYQRGEVKLSLFERALNKIKVNIEEINIEEVKEEIKRIIDKKEVDLARIKKLFR
ncbi:hypothetical protein HRbin06_00412 [archaeon HR06]|nr:hypothetical protein HRbin06_00412 [archaeon HR06]